MSSSTRMYLAHQPVFSEGDASEHAYVVVNGAIEITVQRGGKLIQLDVIRKGQCFGEMGPLTDQPRSTNARALEHSELLVLDKAHLSNFLGQNQPISRAILTSLIERIRKLDRKALSTFDDRMSLTSLARILVLLSKAALAGVAAPAAGPSQGARAATPSPPPPEEMTRLPETATLESLSQLLNMGVPSLRESLKRMEGLNLISFESSPSGRALRFRAGELVANAERLERSLSSLASRERVAEVELQELPAFARTVGMEVTSVLAAFTDGRVPADWLLVRNDTASEFLQLARADRPPAE